MQNRNIDDSKIKTLLRNACGNHRYAILCNGEYGWDDEFYLTNLRELCDIHNTTFLYVYTKASDDVQVFIKF